MQTPFVNSLGISKNPFAQSGSIGSLASSHLKPNGLGQDNSHRVNFQQTLTNSLGKVNEMAALPDKMLMEAVTTGTYDVHDVMMASAKAELAISITTQMATKVIQAYDRILQIQI